jgi:diacylglycerol kinase family enzyme
MINLHARRGSEAVAAAFRQSLPGAKVLASRSLEEAVEFARGLNASPPDLLLSGGGDGTTVALINAIRGQEAFHSTIGCLRLGTGNAWARTMGAPRWKRALQSLSSFLETSQELPTRCFDLVEVDGILAPFAGTGWDAEMIDDFHAQKRGFGILPRRSRLGLAGYLHGLATRTIPRHVFRAKPVEVEIINTGDHALIVDEHGAVVPLEGGEPGATLYRGRVSVCGAGTTPDLGFGFRAFPHAGLVPRSFCMRVYSAGAIEATVRIGQLWRGKRLPKDHNWILTRCTARFSRPVPFQIGGDRVGWKSEVDYRLASEQVNLLDWRRLAA